MPSPSQSCFIPKLLLQDMLLEHEKGSFNDFFCMGGSRTTPHLCGIEARWRTPWRSIMLTIAMLLFVLTFMVVEHTARIGLGNVKLFLGLMFVGSLAVPLGLISVLAEFNLWRNISWARLMGLCAAGGVTSIVFALILFTFGMSKGQISAALVEEPAKIAATLVLAGHAGRNGRILNGILYGAAVGAGFALFESAGYAFEALLKGAMGQHRQLNYQEALSVMAARSLFCLTAGHITWTAITCGALWHSMQGRSLGMALLHPIFLFFLACSITIHGYWNASSSSFAFLSLLPFFTLFTWGLLAIQIHLGIKQIQMTQQYWTEHFGDSEACVWLIGDDETHHGPYCPEEIQSMYKRGMIALDEPCIIGIKEQQRLRLGQLSFLSEADSRCIGPSWYACKRTSWVWLARFCGIMSFASVIFFQYSPRFSFLIYLMSASLLFFILMRVICMRWRSTHRPDRLTDIEGEFKMPPMGRGLWLRLLIPIYNLYWSYHIATNLIRCANLTRQGAMRIPIWVPRLFWITFCAGIALTLSLIIFQAYSFVFYIGFLVLLYPLSAAIMSMALSSIELEQGGHGGTTHDNHCY